MVRCPHLTIAVRGHSCPPQGRQAGAEGGSCLLVIPTPVVLFVAGAWANLISLNVEPMPSIPNLSLTTASGPLLETRHPNVVRYFVREEAGEFVYLALQLCELSLHNAMAQIYAAMVRGAGVAGDAGSERRRPSLLLAVLSRAG